jgi:hypothetical protein
MLNDLSLLLTFLPLFYLSSSLLSSLLSHLLFLLSLHFTYSSLLPPPSLSLLPPYLISEEGVCICDSK